MTIYGAVSVPNGRKLGPRPRDASSEPLVSEDLLKFYREKYRLRFAEALKEGQDTPPPASGSTMDENSRITQTSGRVSATSSMQDKVQSSSSPLCAGVINVLDPLDSSSNLTSHLTQRSVQMLQDSLSQ